MNCDMSCKYRIMAYDQDRGRDAVVCMGSGPSDILRDCKVSKGEILRVFGLDDIFEAAQNALRVSVEYDGDEQIVMDGYSRQELDFMYFWLERWVPVTRRWAWVADFSTQAMVRLKAKPLMQRAA